MKEKQILIVDDSVTVRRAIESILNSADYKNLHFADSASTALELLGINPPRQNHSGHLIYDLILLDIVLPDIDGRVACRLIKAAEHMVDVPIIMVTSLDNADDLKKAFDAGANDYITKPVNEIELLSRLQSSLKLKSEVDRRKEREQELLEVTGQLEKAVKELNRLSSLDGLTGIPNRRSFDETLSREWKRAVRHERVLSMIFMDIDYFKLYNDTYGHLAGDDCLKKTAGLLQSAMQRGSDFLFRYGGEEFVALLPETRLAGAMVIAENMRNKVEAAELENSGSKISNRVTISLGAAEIYPTEYNEQADIINTADEALYTAKETGRNRVVAGQLAGKDTGS